MNDYAVKTLKDALSDQQKHQYFLERQPLTSAREIDLKTTQRRIKELEEALKKLQPIELA